MKSIKYRGFTITKRKDGEVTIKRSGIRFFKQFHLDSINAAKAFLKGYASGKAKRAKRIG